MTDAARWTGVLLLAAGVCALVALVWWSRRRSPGPPEGHLECMTWGQGRPAGYRGSRRAGAGQPLAGDESVAPGWHADQAALARDVDAIAADWRRIMPWADPTRDTVPVHIYPEPGARGVAKVGGGQR